MTRLNGQYHTAAYVGAKWGILVVEGGMRWVDVLPDSGAQVSASCGKELAGGARRNGYDCKRKASVYLLLIEMQTVDGREGEAVANEHFGEAHV